MHRSIATILAIGAIACSTPPPPHWSSGGAPLMLGPAKWERPDDETVEIDLQGRVLEGGSLKFVIDRSGRVIDDEDGPIGLLMPAGEFVGSSNRYLGHVGVTNAAPPHHDMAWLAVLPDGKVQYFNDEGERSEDGQWRGCEGARHRTCTLVTHLIALRRYRGGSPRVGVGVGIMVPL